MTSGRCSFTGSKGLCLVLSLFTLTLHGCTGTASPVQYPQDLTADEVAAIPENMLYVQSDSVLVQWAATYPETTAVWGWIERSMEDGGVTKQQASQTVDMITDWLIQTKPNGNRSGLGGRGRLIGAIEKRDGLTDPQLRKLVDAQHGTSLTIRPDNYNGPMRNFDVHFGSTWTLPLTTNMPMMMFWQLTEVRIDGEPIEIENPHYNPEFVRFRLDLGDLPQGEHTIEARIAVGVTQWRSIYRFNRREKTPDDWPEMRLRWEVIGSDTFTTMPRKAAATDPN